MIHTRAHNSIKIKFVVNVFRWLKYWLLGEDESMKLLEKTMAKVSQDECLLECFNRLDEC